MPAALFFSEAFEMLFDVITALILSQVFGVLSRMIGRRDDVLYYISKPEPWRRRKFVRDRWFAPRRRHSLRAN